MRVLKGDLEITEFVLQDLVQSYGKKLEGEIKSGLYNNDYECPSCDKLNALVDALVCIEESRQEDERINKTGD